MLVHRHYCSSCQGLGIANAVWFNHNFQSMQLRSKYSVLCKSNASQGLSTIFQISSSLHHYSQCSTESFKGPQGLYKKNIGREVAQEGFGRRLLTLWICNDMHT